MLKEKTSYGEIRISNAALADLTAQVASGCFGVAEMKAKNPAEAFLAVFASGRKDRGVKVEVNENRITVDLHIAVLHGINIPAITDSISHKVAYSLSEYTGFPVDAVNVYVDAVISH